MSLTKNKSNFRKSTEEIKNVSRRISVFDKSNKEEIQQSNENEFKTVIMNLEEKLKESELSKKHIKSNFLKVVTNYNTRIINERNNEKKIQSLTESIKQNNEIINNEKKNNEKLSSDYSAISIKNEELIKINEKLRNELEVFLKEVKEKEENLRREKEEEEKKKSEKVVKKNRAIVSPVKVRKKSPQIKITEFSIIRNARKNLENLEFSRGDYIIYLK